MNIARCNYGHYYDGDKFAGCPHCASGNRKADRTVRMSETSDREPTEQRNEGKALKDAVQKAAEKKRLRENESSHPNAGASKRMLPAGILVAAAGDRMGTIYPIQPDSSYIGCTASGAIAVTDSELELPQLFAGLMWNIDTHTFLLTPLSENNIIYLGGTQLWDSQVLQSYDRITIGCNELVFIPICCERFHW
ncbi:MAG: hypothetical protein IJ801_07915 [Lachnospiraceae bacterium]|nr:hypothetical protein [Lachnospiraceae bacterium]